LLIVYKIIAFLIYYVTLPCTFIMSLTGSIKWKQRLGFRHVPAGGKPVDIWLHASSMGEVKVLGILIDRLRSIDGKLKLYLTVMTETGYKKALELADENISVGYLPLDYRSPLRRFFRVVRPAGAVFIETEIWPNTIMALGRNKTPIFLANGRLSERAYNRYHMAVSGMRRLFENYTFMALQSEADCDRYIGLGADRHKIEVVGNMKFDAPVVSMPEDKRRQLAGELPFESGTKIFIAGSTRNGENEIVLDTYAKMAAEIPELRMILVPRHLEHIDSIAGMAAERNLDYCLYSKMNENRDNCRVLIVDKIGVLNDLYYLSDIAFVGGTLVDIGGHNILEPVWAGIPVLYGPSIDNVIDSSEYILAEKFGAQVSDGEQLTRKLLLFFRGELKFEGKTSAAAGSSRADRTARIILKSMDTHAKNLA